MLAVTVLSVGAVVVTQWATLQRARDTLPANVLFRLDEVRRLEGRWFVARLVPEWGGRRPPLAGGGPPGGAPAEWPSIQEAVRGLGRLQDAQLSGVLAGLALAAVLSVVLATLLARTIARPVEAVGAAATRLAAGDLGTRVALPGNPLGASAELESLARDFNAMAESLERAETQRTTMIADIAHELRTPLTAMSLRLDALRDGLTPLGPDEIERLRRQTALLTRLVEDLRTLSLADAGRLALQRAPTDIADLARAVVDAHAPVADAKGVRVSVRAGDATVTPGAWLVDGDRDRLAQVLGNLLDNAVRVAPAGSAVAVEVARDGADVLWRVRDGGPGIAAADLPHVFERFHQGGGRRDTRGASGLGLAIVRTLVDLHGGRVDVEGPAGGGAIFTVRLPAL
jgi:two-component system, OmpR family, sensor histidine kinase BaeS